LRPIPEAPIAPGIDDPITRRAQRRLAVDRVNPGEALLAFGSNFTPWDWTRTIVLNLSPNMASSGGDHLRSPHPRSGGSPPSR
jgi:hypothetical protein